MIKTIIPITILYVSIAQADSNINSFITECLSKYRTNSAEMDCLIALQDVSITCTNFPDRMNPINCQYLNPILNIAPCTKKQIKTIEQFNNCYKSYLNNSADSKCQQIVKKLKNICNNDPLLNDRNINCVHLNISKKTLEVTE